MSTNYLQYSLFVYFTHSMVDEIALHGSNPAQKMFRGQTEATLFQSGTVPVPVPVLSLLNFVRNMSKIIIIF